MVTELELGLELELKSENNISADHKYNKYIKIARVNGVHGIRGQLKIESFTEPSEAFLNYINNKSVSIYWNYNNSWQLMPIKKNSVKAHNSHSSNSKYFVLNIIDCDDRDLARKYQFTEIAVDRVHLPKLDQNEYYWNDLEGLKVYSIYSESEDSKDNKNGKSDRYYMGVVDQIIATGSNDVLVIKQDVSKNLTNNLKNNLKQEHLVPYVLGKYVLSIDLDQKEMIVDWDPEF